MTTFDGYVASLSKSASLVVLPINGSPVKVDSFICNDTASKRCPSAGTSSPVPNITISPTTTSFRETSVIRPFRTTVTWISSLTVFSMSNSLFAFTSKKNPTQLANIIAKKMPNGSKKAENPACSGPKQWTHAMPTDNTHATNNIRIIGSSNFSINCFHNETFAGGVSTFSPCNRRLSSTCSSVSPPICCLFSIFS